MPVRPRGALLLGTWLLAGALFIGSTANAQEPYPGRPVKLIAPQAPGGGVDLLSQASYPVPMVDLKAERAEALRRLDVAKAANQAAP